MSEDHGDELVELPGGEVLLGSDRFYPEERPVHRRRVDGFLIERHLVTNRRFARFVEETGYVTLAERPLDPGDYPGADPALLVPGGLVFRGTDRPVSLADPFRWWAYVPGADWRHPTGPDSDLSGREDHPVVQVGYEDAAAYAAWRGRRLPSEAEWEYAARGGLEGRDYVWGDEPYPDGRHLANTWQGGFPWQNTAEDGYVTTSPVGSFPANGYGLFDMAGNVWEWTSDWWTEQREAPTCCAPARVGGERSSALPGERHGRRTIKGGSHLCSPEYCLRFRPAARQAEAMDTTTSHIGFRCVADLPTGDAAEGAAPGRGERS